MSQHPHSPKRAKKWMRAGLVLLAVPCLAVAQWAWASAPQELRVFAFTTAPEFTGYRAPLVGFLRSEHASGTADVCLLGVEDVNGFRTVKVIWPGGHRMAEWGGGTSPVAHVLNLRTDVVATDQDVGTSTYLVTRAWVRNEEARCDRHGTWVRIGAGR